MTNVPMTMIKGRIQVAWVHTRRYRMYLRKIWHSRTKQFSKTADSMVSEGRSFTGILYAGLIMTKSGPRVIEFNTRFGDPETQVVLPLLKNDLEQVFLDVMDGKDPNLDWKEGFCSGVVVASKGYPMTYEKETTLPKIETQEDSFVVHVGTKLV